MYQLFIHVIELQVGGLMPMQTIAEWLKLQMSDARSVIVAFVGLAVTIGMIWRWVKSGFALSQLIMVGVVAALAFWLIVGGGMQTLSDLFAEQSRAK